MNKIIKSFFTLFCACWLLTSCTISRPTVTQLVPDPPVFMVARQLKYDAIEGELQIVVPVGFITDLASIPRQLWWWESPHETTMAPAIIHDYLYWQQTCTKDESDAVLYLAIKELGLGLIKRTGVYAGVRSPLARLAWKKNQTARNNGESRFFTDSYAGLIMDSPIELGATLSKIQQDAVSNGGMFSPPINNPKLKSACEAALVEFNR